MLAVVNVVVVILTTISIIRTDSADGHYSYSIPQPKIEAFRPRGVRISIPNSPGVRLFAFHANINAPISDLEVGSYSKEVRHQLNGRWIIEDKRIQLHPRDRMCYWLFVIKNTLGYRLDGSCFTVEELLPEPFDPQLYSVTALPPTTELAYIKNTINPPKRKPVIELTTSSISRKEIMRCEESILNSTQHLINLQVELEKYKKLNKLLIMDISEYPGSKQLKMSGRIPPDDAATETVEFILSEKLDLKPKIVWAVREETYTIVFEVSSVIEKYEILVIANEKLINSKISIS